MTSDNILRVSNQNGISLQWYTVEMHHSGWKPSICTWVYYSVTVEYVILSPKYSIMDYNSYLTKVCLITHSSITGLSTQVPLVQKILFLYFQIQHKAVYTVSETDPSVTKKHFKGSITGVINDINTMLIQTKMKICTRRQLQKQINTAG